MIMTADAGNLAALIERLEIDVSVASAALRREQRRARWVRSVDRALTAMVLVAVSLSLVAAAAPVASPVGAPFVVKAGDDTIFEARPDGFLLYRPAAGIGVGAVAGSTRAEIVAGSVDGTSQAVLGLASYKDPTLTLRHGGKVNRLSMTVKGDEPTLNLTNDNGISIVDLGWGAYHGGHIQLSNADGNAMVAAGMAANGIGVVQTFPTGNPGRGLFGLPGTFLCGVGCPRQ